MTRQVSKPNIFWAPSLETARKIDDEDTVKSIETARYRFAASMADLERCYDEQASRLRAAFVAEVAALYQSEAAQSQAPAGFPAGVFREIWRNNDGNVSMGFNETGGRNRKDRPGLPGILRGQKPLPSGLKRKNWQLGHL